MTPPARLASPTAETAAETAAAAETAEVTAGCPGVLAITLPEDRGEIESMLTQSWAFDLGSPRTEEDERRTELYAAQASRASLRQESDSFAAFLEGLQLEVDLSVVTSKERDRVAQLSTRTNQFNACKSPFQAHELAERQAHGAIAHRVAASDRFGQYGVVGAMISESSPEKRHSAPKTKANKGAPKK